MGLFFLGALSLPPSSAVYGQESDPRGTAANAKQRVNVPYSGSFPPDVPFLPRAIFWFGKVEQTTNYADVRVRYDNQDLRVTFHVIDRLLWYNPNPTPADLTQWDAVSLYLNLDGDTGGTPGTRAYRFDAQLTWWETGTAWQAGYRGDGVSWIPDTVAFQVVQGWRGNVPNDTEEDRGWTADFTIPFASLGLSGPPSTGTVWGLAAVVYDRDDAAGTSIPDQVWPQAMNPDAPSTWGQMRFGLNMYQSPPGMVEGVTTIRQGLNGTTVVDGHVGGHTLCGEGLWPDIFTNWGQANYAGYPQINIQNQWDIADWPCFSKYYVTFPLPALPAGKVILSATLTMHQFGNSWGSGIESSWIEAFSVGEDWDEATLTWNNAPQALENLSGTWVDPMSEPLVWPGVPHTWDVSRAVGDAYNSGEPLRLALYSADGAYHSGRYFSSSDTGDWNAEARPTLRILWGELCSAPGMVCQFTYMPLVLNE